MPRVVPKRGAANAIDPFYDSSLTEGQLRRRKTADHEANHGAMGIVVGHTVPELELSGPEGGACYLHPPVRRTQAELDFERLLIVMAPGILLGDASAGDVEDVHRLARAVACRRKGWSEDAGPALASGDVNRVLAEAAQEVRRLAASPRFQHIRLTLRELLDKNGHVGGRELIDLFGDRPSVAKPTRTAAARKPATGSKGCAGCGASYTPRHESNRCASCRGGL